MQGRLPDRELVLLGAGHTHAHILLRWRMDPISNVRLTCVSEYPFATYSGMLPGVLSGAYSPDRMEIDLVRLCASAGARFLCDSPIKIDPAAKELIFRDRPPLGFDLLSIGIGSQAKIVGRSEAAISIKPMQTFLPRLNSRLDALESQEPASGPAERNSGRTWTFAVIGGGAAGIELACCLPVYLAAKRPARRVRVVLIDRHETVLRGASARGRRLAEESLRRRGIEIRTRCEASEVLEDGTIVLSKSEPIRADVILWATSAIAPPLLRESGLPLDDRGFLLTRATLQSTASEAIFAVGDCGTVSEYAEEQLPKAGVYAVRQGPVLWENLKRIFASRPLLRWRPQRTFLRLLNLGDRRALLLYGPVATTGEWCWRWKDSIDRRFMDRHQDYSPRMPASVPSSAPPSAAMQCGGCGCKLPAASLSRVLKRLAVEHDPDVLIGLQSPDDVALLAPFPNAPIAVSADFFSPFLDDPFLLGRVAALNALSDFYAKGARARAAIAMAIVPRGSPRRQEELLAEMLEGGLREFRRRDSRFHPAGVPLAGGHTIEGEQCILGFTLLGTAEGTTPLKGKLAAGDQLILTKPLGSGVLLASLPRAECRASWLAPLLASLLASNAAAGEVAARFQLAAVTDVTGFGLAGHLLEMLRASEKSAVVRLESLPLLPGALDLLSRGVESTLAPANRDCEPFLHFRSGTQNGSPNARGARYQSLFDPQTSGGLLLAAPKQRVAEILKSLEDSGVDSHVIGEVEPGPAKIVLG